VEDFVTASLPTTDEVAGTVANWNAPVENLAFALLRLTEPVPAGPDGNERGAYRLDSTVCNFAARHQLLFIVQHPLGDFQRITFLRNAPQPNPNGTRIRYAGSPLTLRRTSGCATSCARQLRASSSRSGSIFAITSI
jgi:hypothetical protein